MRDDVSNNALPNAADLTGGMNKRQLTFVSEHLNLVPVPPKTLLGKIRQALSGSEIRRKREENREILDGYKKYCAEKLKLEARIAQVDVFYADAFVEFPHLSQTLAEVRSQKEAGFKEITTVGTRREYQYGETHMVFLRKELNDAVKTVDQARKATLAVDAQAAASDIQSIDSQKKALAAQVKQARHNLRDLIALKDQPELDPVLIAVPIKTGFDTKSVEATRKQAKARLDLVHKSADAALTRVEEQLREMSPPAPGSRVAQRPRKPVRLSEINDLRKDLSNYMDNLLKDRAKPVALLLSLAGDLQDSAKHQMDQLGRTNPVAHRETARAAVLRDEGTRLHIAIEAAQGRVTEMRQAVQTATGFNQRKTQLAAIRENVTQLRVLEARLAQIEAYNAGAADRLAKIVKVGIRHSEADKQIKAAANALARAEAVPPQGETSDAEAMKKRIAHLESRYRKAAKTVDGSARLFLLETPMTEISAKESATLLGCLAVASKLVPRGDLKRAQSWVQKAEALHENFKSARHFKLPPVPDVEKDPLKFLDTRIELIVVMIDDMWGRGGEVRLFRDRIFRLKERRAELPERPSPAATIVDRDLRHLQDEVAKAALEAQATPIAQQDQKLMSARVNQMADALLAMHKTKAIPLADAHKYPRDHMLIRTGSDGTPECHVIDTKKDETIDRRSDTFKHVPRKLMTNLREGMQALELMLEHPLPDQEDVVREIADDWAGTAKWLMNDGEAFFSKLDARIKKVDAVAQNKLLRAWSLNGLGALRERWDTFKDTCRAEVPKDSESVLHRADAFEAEFQAMLTRASDFSDRQKEATSALIALDEALGASTSANDAAIGVTLNEVMKSRNFVQNLVGDRELTNVEEGYKKQIIAAVRQLNSMDKDFRGVQGKARLDVDRLHDQVKVKTEDSLVAVETEAASLRQGLVQKRTELKSLICVEAGAAPDLKRLAEVLTDTARDSAATKAAHDEMIKQAELVRKARKDLAASLSKEHADHPNAKTVASILKMLIAKKDEIKKTFKNRNDAGAAAAEYKQLLAQLVQLPKDLLATNADADADGRAPYSFDGVNKDIQGALKALSAAAGNVSAQVAEAVANEPSALEDAKTVVSRVHKTLSQIDRWLLGRVEPFKSRAAAEVQEVYNLPRTSPERQKDMPRLREAVLTDLRACRAKFDVDPAIRAYRANPFDNGVGTRQLDATFDRVQTQITKDLAP